MITRRGLLRGVGSLLAAPAIVRVASLMPVKALSLRITDTVYNNAWMREQLAELISQSNEIMADMMVWRHEGLPLGKTSVRTRLAKHVLTFSASIGSAE